MFVTIHVKSPTAPMPGHLDARQFLRHVGVRLRWRRSRLKLNWQRGLAKGSGNVENIHPNGWRAPKLMVCKRWHQLMARIRYLCWVSGLQSWIGVSSKLDFLEHFSPKWWLWCWYFFTFCDEAIQHEKLRELLRSLIWPSCPLRADFNQMKFQARKKRPTSLIFHGSWNLSFLSF